QYLALTGHRFDGAECLALGLATHFLASDTLDTAKARIAETPQDIVGVLDALATSAPDAKILACKDDIDRLFASDVLEEIY
ncbi:enoyl-CoA hydratase/isomerase family protein, partial [Pseudomonas aeruginosa]